MRVTRPKTRGDATAHEGATAVLAAADPVLARIITAAGPCTIATRRLGNPYEALFSAIVHQQIHGKAAAAILGRVQTHFGVPGAFPQPAQILASPDEPLRAAGLSGAKTAAIKDLAAKADAGRVPSAAQLRRMDDEAIVERLTEIRGIGRWTVEMMLIFQLGRPDVLPVGDFGVRNGFRIAYRKRAMPTPSALLRFGERWRPHRTTASWYLWRAVDVARATRS